MELTKEFLDNLPMSNMPDDYDGVDELTELILTEFNNECDKIDKKYESPCNNSHRLVGENKN